MVNDTGDDIESLARRNVLYREDFRISCTGIHKMSARIVVIENVLICPACVLCIEVSAVLTESDAVSPAVGLDSEFAGIALNYLSVLRLRYILELAARGVYLNGSRCSAFFLLAEYRRSVSDFFSDKEQHSLLFL